MIWLNREGSIPLQAERCVFPLLGWTGECSHKLNSNGGGNTRMKASKNALVSGMAEGLGPNSVDAELRGARPVGQSLALWPSPACTGPRSVSSVSLPQFPGYMVFYLPISRAEVRFTVDR